MFTPDGKSVIANRRNPTSTEANIWLIDIASGTRTAMSPSPRPQEGGAISPDGKTVLALK